MPGRVGLLRWDHSTKGSEHSNVTDPLSLAELNRDTGADGFNGGAAAARCQPLDVLASLVGLVACLLR